MKIHTTNYTNTFIQVAEDSPAKAGELPPVKSDKPTVANLQFDRLIKHPYQYTSDDIVFHVFAEKNSIPKAEQKGARVAFFSKGQPCLRASPLTKRYGWGVHCDEEGKIALYACDSEEYKRYVEDKSLMQMKAMRSKR
ncbi:MAG: hypothetical protein EOP56_07785 [Sphingobacteriales bacterium]|nr:MAG: hypothetical protein EOP56_07785 [Sphingobacteriales bacterium]